MMMNVKFLLALLACLPAALCGQERLSLILENQPVEEVFRYIEAHTPYRIFCLPQYADTLMVTLQVTDADAVELLNTALKGSELKVSPYRYDLFITPHTGLMTSLPAGYFEQTLRREETDAARPTVFESLPTRTEDPDMRVYELDEVLISSSRMRENVRGTTLGVERLEVKDIKNIPGVFGERDILRIVVSLPGVKTVGEASSGFNVRGGATDQNLILFNGGTIYNPTHLFGFFSAINPEVVQDMELFKSSIPAKYGGRISSVLEMNGREGDKEKFGGSASIGLLTSRLTLEGPLGGFYDLNATIAHKFSNYDNLVLSGYFSRDRFNFNTDEQYAYRNAGVPAKWKRDRLSGLSRFQIIAGVHIRHKRPASLCRPGAGSGCVVGFGKTKVYCMTGFIL